MRKPIVVLLLLAVFLTACAKNSASSFLTQLPGDYTLDDAKTDGCVVYEDGSITDGQQAWDAFVAATNSAKAASVRLAFYYTLGDPSHYAKEYYEEIKDKYPVLSLQDLRFDGKKYTIQSMEDGKLDTKEYKYLLRYEGKPGSSDAIFSHYVYYVLVQDDTVTWDQIEHGMISSQSGDWIDHRTVYTCLTMK